MRLYFSQNYIVMRRQSMSEPAEMVKDICNNYLLRLKFGIFLCNVDELFFCERFKLFI